MGILKDLLQRRWFTFANGIEITYIRPIKPFEKFRLRSKIASWDDKYWYAEHCFEVGDQICAIAIVRGAFVKGRSLVSMNEVVSLTGADPLSPPPSKIMKQWKTLMKVKKDEYTASTAANNDN